MTQRKLTNQTNSSILQWLHWYSEITMHLTHSVMVQINMYIKLLGYCWTHGKGSVSESYYVCCYIKIRARADNFWNSSDSKGFPCDPVGGKEPACQCRRHGFNPWVGKISLRRKWQSTPVFLPGESHGQRILVGYSLWGCKARDMTSLLNNNNNSFLIAFGKYWLFFFLTLVLWVLISTAIFKGNDSLKHYRERHE